VKFDCKNFCDICHYSKQHKLPFQQSTSCTLNCFDLIYVDIWEPTNFSIHGHKYFLTVVDGHSRHTWNFPMIIKAETKNLLQNFAIFVQNQFERKIKTIRFDNGQEFMNQDFYNKYGIIHQRSCVETPQQNAIVEHKHQHILNVARSLMFQSNLPRSYWNYTLMHVIYLINRLPTIVLTNKCPYEILYKEPPPSLILRFLDHSILLQLFKDNKESLIQELETPQQNAIVEHKHQHILNVARSLMFQSNLPISYWNYALMHVVDLINRLLP